MTEGSDRSVAMIREEWKDAGGKKRSRGETEESGVSTTGVPLAPIT